MKSTRKLLFIFFFVSGFCALLYEVVWLRLAFASFGVITPVVSVVISVFMLGLALGSWLGGKWILQLVRKTKLSAAVFYGISELIIGIGAFVVPYSFSLGEQLLLPVGEMASASYLFYSFLILLLSIMPWTFMMGTTFPFMMAFAKGEGLADKDGSSFSYLYLGNVIGSMCGAALTAFALIEVLTLKNTLVLAGGLNFLIAGVALTIGLGSKAVVPAQAKKSKDSKLSLSSVILFTTGFTSMAMEVVWTRLFTPVVKTTVYAFALLLVTYLFATWIGSWLYRRDLKQRKVKSTTLLLSYLALFSFLPILLNDPRLHLWVYGILFSVIPFCAALGYITPKLIDESAQGNPEGAGRDYGMNVLGCILGPIFASYFMLPVLSGKMALILLAAPFAVLVVLKNRKPAFVATLASVILCAIFVNKAYDNFEGRTYNGSLVKGSQVLRDHTATVVSFTREDQQKELLVNGIGVTGLSPVTKVMAHMPLAFLNKKPESALVICFGMGTTFRSLLTWGIKATAVELVPSVKNAFPYYYSDAPEVLANKNGRIVIDDGRRFLRRTSEKFDVITLDPPPPVEAAGSSLLYSENFYDLVKEHLNKGGILQQWFPGGETKIFQAVARSIVKSFPYVKVYPGIIGWGHHFLASLEPISKVQEEEFLAKLSQKAKEDLLELNPRKTVKEIVHDILDREVDVASILNPDPRVAITDNRPFNEYFLLRRTLQRLGKN
ncbi:MAG: hypothetical protein AB7F43_12805 [Bacteriovoracia bacterium]